MKNRLPQGLILVAVLQFVPLIILPPDILKGIGIELWGVIAALFVVLGFNLLRQKSWSRVATIFVQGMNILVHILVVVSHARVGGDPTAAWDAWLLSSSLVSVLLSGAILYYVDLPDVQMLMQ
ncbi:MAG: hypothetical protein ACYC4R_07915 [Anaerolineae bacterium]